MLSELARLTNCARARVYQELHWYPSLHFKCQADIWREPAANSRLIAVGGTLGHELAVQKWTILVTRDPRAAHAITHGFAIDEHSAAPLGRSRPSRRSHNLLNCIRNFTIAPRQKYETGGDRRG
jgi:hypothetical protein